MCWRFRRPFSCTIWSAVVCVTSFPNADVSRHGLASLNNETNKVARSAQKGDAQQTAINRTSPYTVRTLASTSVGCKQTDCSLSTLVLFVAQTHSIAQVALPIWALALFDLTTSYTCFDVVDERHQYVFIVREGEGGGVLYRRKPVQRRRPPMNKPRRKKPNNTKMRTKKTEEIYWYMASLTMRPCKPGTTRRSQRAPAGSRQTRRAAGPAAPRRVRPKT